MPRDWEAARAKVEAEVRCRVCQYSALDAAHIIPRSRVSPGPGEDPRNIVPLCRMCHAAYDQGTLDILPYLSREEQAYAVELVGLAEAYRRTTNERLAA
jgi:cytochrome c553